jgi:glycosyltransferase involved in cell wall biosynthesis
VVELLPPGSLDRVSLSVSVAMCTRNSSRFIGPQIDSILAQSVPPNELIVADDASTDDTVQRIECAVERAGTPFPLVVLTAEEPFGVTKNFERAVRACASDLIALSDHDDVWHSDRLETDVAAFEHDDDLLLLHSNAVLIDEDGRPLDRDLFESLRVSGDELEAIAEGNGFEVYIRRNLVTGAATMFRRSLLEAALPFPEHWVHDEWLGIIAAAFDGARASRTAVIDYRQHGRNQIGVRPPSLRNRLGRMVQPRVDRYVRIARRSELLVERIDTLPVSERWKELAHRKRDFERVRAAYPRPRLRRVGPVLRQWRSGDYALLSSQRAVDVVRDLVQPAGSA